MVHPYSPINQNTRLEVVSHLHHRVHGHLAVVGLLDRVQAHQVILPVPVVARKV